MPRALIAGMTTDLALAIDEGPAGSGSIRVSSGAIEPAGPARMLALGYVADIRSIRVHPLVTQWLESWDVGQPDTLANVRESSVACACPGQEVEIRDIRCQSWRYARVGGPRPARLTRMRTREATRHDRLAIPNDQYFELVDRGAESWQIPSPRSRLPPVSVLYGCPSGVICFQFSFGFLSDWQGFNAAGWDCYGFDRSGYNASGYDRGGFDRLGYDAQGYDCDGVNRDGSHRADCQCSECAPGEYHGAPRDWPIPSEWEGSILYGIENEIDAGNEARRLKAYKARPKGDWYIIGERDGSLGPHGIEFVGPPLPFGWYLPGRRAHSGNPWIAFLDSIRGMGCKIPNNEHGLHLNVSRAPIARHPAWERRFLETLNSCRALIEHVAGRKANRWAKWSEGDSRFEVCGTKYRVANVKAHVIEIRIFKATLDPARLRAIVQFVHALLRWTRRGLRSKGDACDKRILGWIRAHASICPDLIPLLASYVPWQAPAVVPVPVSAGALVVGCAVRVRSTGGWFSMITNAPGYQDIWPAGDYRRNGDGRDLARGDVGTLVALHPCNGPEQDRLLRAFVRVGACVYCVTPDSLVPMES